MAIYTVSQASQVTLSLCQSCMDTVHHVRSVKERVSIALHFSDHFYGCSLLLFSHLLSLFRLFIDMIIKIHSLNWNISKKILKYTDFT